MFKDNTASQQSSDSIKYFILLVNLTSYLDKEVKDLILLVSQLCELWVVTVM